MAKASAILTSAKADDMVIKKTKESLMVAWGVDIMKHADDHLRCATLFS